MVILSVISFLGYCLAISLAAGWAMEAMPLFVSAALIAALYLAALAGGLAAAGKILFWAGLALFSGAVISVSLRRDRMPGGFHRLPAPGIVILTAVLAASWFRTRGQVFLEWDAFSHWGLVIKDMFLSGSLPAAESAVVFKDYPPAATLFQYFMGAPAGYCEGNAFFFHSMLLFSGAAAFTSGFSWRTLQAAAAAFLLPCLLLYFFGFSFDTVMVDSLIGLFAGAALAAYFLSEDSPAAAALRAAPVLFVLPLFKPVGAFLAFTVAAAIVADIMSRALPGGAPAAAAVRPRAIRYALLVSAALLLSPAVSYLGWSHRVKALGFAGTFSTDIAVSSLAGGFSARATARDKATIAAFAGAIVKGKMGKPRLPPSVWALLLLGIAALFFFRAEPGERFRVISSQTVMSAGFIAYSFGLLALYMRSFGEYEGVRLASFARYMGLFMLAWGASLAGFAARRFRVKERRGLRPGCAAALAAAILAAWAFIPVNSGRFAVRRTVAAAVAPAKAALKPGERVYLLWQNTSGYEYWISRYELAPAVSSRDPFSVGRKYGERDVWTQDLAVKDWAAMLSKNDYLLIGRADAAFWRRYGSLFAGDPLSCGSGLFRIRGPGGSVRLECSGQGSGT